MNDHPTPPLEVAERWLPVVGWEGLYEVSDLGRVRALPRMTATGIHGGRRPELAQFPGSNGYMRVKLSLNGRSKRFMVHHLVTDAFLGPIPRGLVRRHLNDNRSDNRLVNLTFGTYADNAQDAMRNQPLWQIRGSEHCCSKLTEDKVREIRRRHAAGGISQGALAREYGVKQPTIHDVVNWVTWKHVA